MKNWLQVILHIWRALGFIFLGFGFVLLIYSLILGVMASSAISSLNQQSVNTIFLTAFMPLTLPAFLCFVIGFTGILTGRNIENYENQEEPENILKRLSKLEYIIDNNFEVINKRLNKKEEQQKRTSQDTILKATD